MKIVLTYNDSSHLEEVERERVRIMHDHRPGRGVLYFASERLFVLSLQQSLAKGVLKISSILGILSPRASALSRERITRLPVFRLRPSAVYSSVTSQSMFFSLEDHFIFSLLKNPCTLPPI